MTTERNNMQNSDDQVLAQLYKEGAKDQPPTSLDDKIINYAANANKPNSNSSQANNKTESQVGSHFGGGWKVPLSMAASVVVVFALLVQLEQSPQQLELPPIPEISAPTESKEELFKNKAATTDIQAQDTLEDDASFMRQDASDLGAASDRTIDLKEKPSSTILTMPSTTSTVQQKNPPLHDRLILEESANNSNRNDEIRTEGESDQGISALSNTDTLEPESIKTPAATASKPHAQKKQIQKHGNNPVTDSSEVSPKEAMQQRSTINESATQIDGNAGAIPGKASEISPTISSDTSPESEQEFAPIPIDNWLLMIEQLVARKDYAEAARQLKKFKYAHPDINVEDLDAKIP